MPQMPDVGHGLLHETTPQSQVEVPMTLTSVPSATLQPMAPYMDIELTDRDRDAAGRPSLAAHSGQSAPADSLASWTFV